MAEKTTRKVWSLESGFATESEERDAWFAKNPIFLVRKDKETGHLWFMPVAYAYADKYDREDMLNNMVCWETTKAEKVEESGDKKYKCFETASGTRYHLWQAGELTLG